MKLHGFEVGEAVEEGPGVAADPEINSVTQRQQARHAQQEIKPAAGKGEISA